MEELKKNNDEIRAILDEIPAILKERNDKTLAAFQDIFQDISDKLNKLATLVNDVISRCDNQEKMIEALESGNQEMKNMSLTLTESECAAGMAYLMSCNNASISNNNTTINPSKNFGALATSISAALQNNADDSQAVIASMQLN